MRASEVQIALADLGSSQWGLLTAVQAQQLGVNRARLARLTTAGVLVRLTHGVYALRGAMSADHVELRAVWLALDPGRLAADRIGDGVTGAVVSHASAAVLHGLGDLGADRHEFSAPTRKQTRRPELRLHRARLTDDDITLYEGLPVTTVPRTIVDLVSDGHDGGHIAGVLADAVRTRRVDPAQLALRLAPFATRFGLPRRDGRALVAYLLEVGGVTEQADADLIATAARTAQFPVLDVLATLTIASTVAQQLSAQLAPVRELAAWRQSQLAPILGQLAEQTSALSGLRDAMAPVRELAAQMQAERDPLSAGPAQPPGEPTPEQGGSERGS